ncbi:conserved hypothetical protein [Rippkaea orientalis PCC 8801]|uniref:RSAM-associated Gly-rich repeat protein n=1 Tax=Rippkaea orientalis (strain PCC 8801 / RF-1) TaxID=41431 RepID=B7JUH9_RIPO1|nr:GrrA/OscA1 family cyclophane-containing rSAM-modified RiPP [Rippkaea orientalis]ACK65523.1 conserved hypothetical protein [Rippkaea orientalis PCC 8801]
MKLTTTSWLGFLVTLSALNLPAAKAINPATTSETLSVSQPLESRLSRLSTTLKARETIISDIPLTKPIDVAIGWGDGRGNRGFVNTNRGGWGNANSGGFGNINPWRNGWADAGGFRNHGGGGFVNRGGGGGFVNRGGGFINR